MSSSIIITGFPWEETAPFSHDHKVSNTRNLIPVTIACTNGIGERVEMRFTLKIVDSKSGLWDIKYSEDSRVYRPLTADPVYPGGSKVLLSGRYYGLVGAHVGYEIYSVRPGEDDAPLESGQFVITKDGTAQDSDGHILGTDYESGEFADQSIDLIPNEQRLVIYVENPGGVRHEYMVGDKGNKLYPRFIYTMPTADQKIEFVDVSTVRLAVESGSPPYVFTSRDSITGRIVSMEHFDSILARSNTPGLVFENGEDEMILPVGAGNRFSIPFSAEMGEDIQSEFTVEVTPTIPAFSFLRKIIELTVKKDFRQTQFVPDLSRHPS